MKIKSSLALVLRLNCEWAEMAKKNLTQRRKGAKKQD